MKKRSNLSYAAKKITNQIEKNGKSFVQIPAISTNSSLFFEVNFCPFFCDKKKLKFFKDFFFMFLNKIK